LQLKPGNLFDDVEQIAKLCRFNDCEHRSEPGCAIKAAIDAGELDAARLESYRKLQRLRTEERRKWKRISVDNKVRERLLGH
jgi:ribosome biogenesis GTPase